MVAWLEDDFHHFGIEVRHDGEKVIAVDGQAARFPRDTCPGAVGILQEVVGMPLDKRATALGQYTNMRMHCTHLYDLLGLAIAHAACGREHRRYEAMVPDREPLDSANAYSRVGGRTAPRLYRDGQLVMSWEVEGNLITGPAHVRRYLDGAWFSGVDGIPGHRSGRSRPCVTARGTHRPGTSD